MIKLTRLNNDELIVNVDLIEFVEATPDTIVTMTTGRKVMVRESAERVMGLVRSWKQETQQLTKAADDAAVSRGPLLRHAPIAAEGVMYGR